MFNYCTLNDVKQWLAGLDVSEMPPTLDLIIEQNYIPWAKRQVDGFIGENLDLTTVTEYYDGSGRIELILNHRPISFLRKCVLRLIPSVQWFEFKRWFHLNNVDQLGITVAVKGGVEPNTTNDNPPYTFVSGSPVPADMIGTPTATFNDTTAQFEKSDLIVDCRKGILSIPARILYLENQALPFWNYTWLRSNSNIEVTYDYGYKDIDSLPQEIRSATAQFVAAAVLSTKGQFMGGGISSFSLTSGSKSFGEMPFASHIKMYIESAKATLTPYKRIRV